MEKILIPFFISFLIALFSTPLTIKFARKYGLVDDPSKRPHPAHIQNRIVPRAGGLSLYLAIIIPLLVFIPLSKSVAGIILGLSLLLLIGLLDDYLKNLSPFPRLGIQFLAALIVVASGVGITFTTNPFGGILRLDEIIWTINFLGTHTIIVIADLFALIWITGMMNMINWANGVDGQTPSIVIVAAVVIGILSFRLFQAGDPNQLTIALIAFITAGACLGFQIFHWYPAKIFLGFAGTTILGFLIATLSIMSGAKLATALLVLLIPAIDFGYTVIRRIVSKKSPFFGDQQHLHHLLLKRGWSHSQIALFYFVTSAVLGFAAINLESAGKLFTVVGAGTIVLGVILWLHLFYKKPEIS